jgi:hypothetical protein
MKFYQEVCNYEPVDQKTLNECLFDEFALKNEKVFQHGPVEINVDEIKENFEVNFLKITSEDHEFEIQRDEWHGFCIWNKLYQLKMKSYCRQGKHENMPRSIVCFFCYSFF